MSRHGDVRALAFLPHELEALRRALAALVVAEGRSKTSDDLAAMLANPPPVDVLRELERDDSGPS